MKNMILPIILLVASIIVGINGHGRMEDPPARNVMWRYGYDNPPDYDDNQLYCGGFTVQYETNGGKCGVCGDDYRDAVPRAHEDGGTYGNGIIVRSYTVGQEIDIYIELTANHQGWFEIKICPNDDVTKVTDQECLDQYPLKVVGKDTTKFTIPSDIISAANFTYKVQLPESLTCSQCVIQWHYNTASNWGTCENGTQGMGCGPQETFINCADVEILPNVQQDHGVKPISSHQKLRPLVLSRTCVAIGEFAKTKDAHKFCHQNCLKPGSYCPEDKCKCI